MGSILQDVRFAFRLLAKSPLTTAVALLTLALGIGANTAVFSVVHSVLLSPLPYAQPEQLVRITGDLRRQDIKDVGLSANELFDYQQRSDIFSGLSGVYPIDANITGADQPTRAEALLVDTNYFSLLGINAVRGRMFDQRDYTNGIGNTAVLSYQYWRDHYGSDPNILGRSLRLDNDQYSIVGVAPEGFHHPGKTLTNAVEVWIPSGWKGAPFPPQPVRTAYFLQGALARLKPGVTVEQAQERLNGLAENLRQTYPDAYAPGAGWNPRIVPLHDDLVGNVRPALVILFCAALLVLLIACTNVANLQLAKASERNHEFALRTALGAARGRLIRQLLIESTVISTLGGIIGILVGVWGVSLLRSWSPVQVTELSQIRIDATVLLFAFFTSLITGVLFGSAPALQSASPEMNDFLKDASRTSSGSRSRARVRAALIISEISLAVVLLIAAALIVRSFQKLQSVDPGFDSQHTVTARIWLPAPNDSASGPYFQHPRRAQLYRDIQEKMRSFPGVEQVAITSLLPMTGGQGSAPFLLEGQTNLRNTGRTILTNVTPSYFSTLNVPLRSGRLFTSTDTEKTTPVTVISKSFAQRYLPNEDPIGRRLRLAFPPNTPNPTVPPWLTIIGVVDDIKVAGLDSDIAPQIYRSMDQFSSFNVAVLLKTNAAPQEMERVLKLQVQVLDRDLPVYSVRSMDEVIAKSLAQRRFATRLLSGFAVIALLLAAIGIYGMLSYAVTQRTRELGVRMALGAQRRDLLLLIFGQAGRLAGIGMLVGLIGAWVISRWLGTLLFGITPTDAGCYAAVILLLSSMTAVASYIPARRAMLLDPIDALRRE